MPPSPRSTLFPYTTLFRSQFVIRSRGFEGHASVPSQSVDYTHAHRLPRRQPAAQCDARERSEEHTSELQSHHDLVCRLLLEQKKIHFPSLLFNNFHTQVIL